MNENYDVKGSVRRIEQRTPGVSGLERLRNRNSFDVDFSPTGQALRITNYKNSGDVDDSRENVFDTNGVHVRTIFFDSDGAETGRTELQHDESRCTGWLAFDAVGTLLRRCEKQFSGNRIATTDTQLANGCPVVEEVFEYSGDLLVKSLSRYYGLDGNLANQWISSYDSGGRVIETWGLTAEGKPLGDGRYKRKYDEQGRESQVLSFNDWDTENVPNAISLCEYSCDDFGNWIERRKYHRFKSDSRWRTTVTTRKITYWQESSA